MSLVLKWNLKKIRSYPLHPFVHDCVTQVLDKQISIHEYKKRIMQCTLYGLIQSEILDYLQSDSVVTSPWDQIEDYRHSRSQTDLIQEIKTFLHEPRHVHTVYEKLRDVLQETDLSLQSIFFSLLKPLANSGENTSTVVDHLYALLVYHHLKRTNLFYPEERYCQEIQEIIRALRVYKDGDPAHFWTRTDWLPETITGVHPIEQPIAIHCVWDIFVG